MSAGPNETSGRPSIRPCRASSASMAGRRLAFSTWSPVSWSKNLGERRGAAGRVGVGMGGSIADLVADPAAIGAQTGYGPEPSCGLSAQPGRDDQATDVRDARRLYRLFRRRSPPLVRTGA